MGIGIEMELEMDPSPAEISKEELAFISQLYSSTVDEFQGVAGSATVDAPDITSNLLNILLLADNIRIQADVDNFTLSFEPRVEYSPEGSIRQLHLGYPSISETTHNFRSHRINEINGDIGIRETGDMLKSIRIENISETGMGLSSGTAIPDIIPGKTVLSLKISF